MVNPKPLAFVLTAALALAAAPAVRAQADGAETAKLSLDECLRTALENNLDLVSARKDPAIAEQRIQQNRASFDGELGASAGFNQIAADQTITQTITDQVTMTSVTVNSAGSFDQDLLTGEISWNQLLGYGATYGVALRSEDTDQLSRSIETATQAFQDRTQDSLDEDVTFTYSMPLLRGLGKEVTQVDVLLARSGVEISNEDLRLRAIETLKSTEDAYWDLVASREAYRVAEESLKLAEDLWELNKRKVEVGALAPIEVTQAEAGVASREEDVIVAEVGVRNAEDNLRRFLAVPADDPMWLAVLEPTDEPTFEEKAVDVQAATATALERRPEMINSRRSLDNDELQERVARNGARHSLTLDARLSPFEQDSNERVETLNVAPPQPTFDTRVIGDGETWRVGLTYGYTIGNRRAKADYAIARLNREKSELGVSIVEQDIRVDVRAAARAVTSGAKRVAAARANSVLQRKNVEAERKKFENGMSTSFEVLRIQNDLFDAQLAEIRAVLDYTKSLADLERAKGTLLEARGLSLGQ